MTEKLKYLTWYWMLSYISTQGEQSLVVIGSSIPGRNEPLIVWQVISHGPCDCPCSAIFWMSLQRSSHLCRSKERGWLLACAAAYTQYYADFLASRIYSIHCIRWNVQDEAHEIGQFCIVLGRTPEIRVRVVKLLRCVAESGRG